MAEGFKIADIRADLKLDSGNLERGIATAKTAIQSLDREIAALDAAYQRGEMSLRAYSTELTRLTNSQKELASLSARAKSELAILPAAAASTATAANSMSAGLGRAGGSTKQFGFALMQVGNIADDAQYGFQGVVNNIGPLATALSGGNLAIGAAAQIAAVAIAQLVNHWDDLKQSMGFSVIRKEADEMERLAKETYLAADAEAHYKRVKRRDAETKRREGNATPDEEEATRRAQKAVDEAGEENLIKGLIATREGQLKAKAALKNTPEWNQVNRDLAAEQKVQNLITNNGTLGPGNLTEHQRKQLEESKVREQKAREKRDAMIRDAAKDMLSETTVDKDKRHQLRTLIRENPGAFGPRGSELSLSLGLATPERVKEERREKELIETRAEIEAMQDRQSAAIATQLEASGAAPGSLRRLALTGGGRESGALEADVKESMRAAGYTKGEVDDLGHKVFRKLIEGVDEEVRRYALKHGTTEESARATILDTERMKREQGIQGAKDRVREARERVEDIEEQIRRKQRDHMKSTLEDTGSYARKMAIGGMRDQDYQRDMLKMQRELKDATDNVAKAVKDLDIKSRATE